MLENLNIPSVSARMANDIIPYSHRNYLGMSGIRGRRGAVRAMRESDLLITLGTSNCYTFFGEKGDCLSPDCKMVVVNIDEKIFNRDDIQIDLGIKADLKQFLLEICILWNF